MHPIAPKSILVVDDDTGVAEALHMVLSMDGHKADTAGDGEAALVRCNGGAYDVVLTDFLMPGIDGLELARLIKERAPHTPVVLVTAHPEMVLRRHQPRLKHVDAVVVKPFTLEELNEALKVVFPNG